jgi:starch synthase (maltosyl-transferring)
MDNSNWVIQDPAPGTHILIFRGDTRTFNLSLSRPGKGNAWLRTNIGHAQTARQEIIRKVANDKPPLGRDWFDIPMCRVDGKNFTITLPFCEVGHFEAKCFFLSEKETTPLWPEGPNLAINVEPAHTCCSNIIYNAFVRQFGPNKTGKFFSGTDEDSIRALDKNGYTVIPPSGTFRDLIGELDFIIGELGCRIIQLLPIYPTPTTYARMGRFGSPYAALSFTAVDPALAEFDPKATPLEQFIELIDAIHERHAMVFIDIAINHTGWAASLHETHPQWLVRNPDGQIKMPGAWGVVWADLTSLDYTQKDLWQFMADVFITWCRRGVDGFRCDAGYMIPVPAWKYIVAAVRDQYPDTIFLLEGLGGKISVSRDLLNQANFNWSYSELFQNYDRSQIETYLPGANEISVSDGITIHFAETHDNPRLAAQSKTFARMRTSLCALCSHQGGFGFANGVEWYATEKIIVHEATSLNWGAATNQVKHIRRLNTLLNIHPAFHDRTQLKMVQRGDGNCIVLLRHHVPSGKKLLIVANLDDRRQTVASWNPEETGMDASNFVDLISGEKTAIAESEGKQSLLLDSGRVFCFTDDPNDRDLVGEVESKTVAYPDRIKKQCLRAKAMDVLHFYNGARDPGKFEPDTAARKLAENPIEYCRSLNPFSKEPRVITWQWPHDKQREVMVPPDHFLMVRADRAFHARIMDKNRCLYHEESLICTDGSFFILFSPLPPPKMHCSYTLKVSVYTPGHTQHVDAPLLFLSRPEDARVNRIYYRPDLSRYSPLLLCTNGYGGMLRAAVSWGKLASRYDALLAANMNPEIPEDRWVMFTRCRAWLVYQGYSQEICDDCFDSFCFQSRGRGVWRYQVPTGQGEHVFLTVCVEMIPGKNSMRMVFIRDSAKSRQGMLADHEPVRLILRPDIESRNFHETTKAYQGPEYFWPGAVRSDKDGFTFVPDQEHRLNLKISDGSFVWEPEWQYMVHRPIEAERGLDADSDLFSPGYFSSFLKGGETETLNASITGAQNSRVPNQKPRVRDVEPELVEQKRFCKPFEALTTALDDYVVKRNDLDTVIAGYPWFLDWGRDALIFVRGLIAAGKMDEARSILKQFGQFESNGTIPNMIRGKDAGNRNTSDAPLWFFVACADLVRIQGNEDFLDSTCGDRTIRDILFSIASAYEKGTPNGIHMDPESCLIFSPTHFTWMDTNHPAGTPRQGYPIEIQALWFAALSFLTRIDPSGDAGDWTDRASRVQASISNLFWLEKSGYLSDCLHTDSGKPAARANADDALRPNQLFAVTLGAVPDPAICRKIVAACEELLVPGAVRSLADRPVSRPMPIYHNGTTINNPHHPYQGKYTGEEDLKRKPAYHNGTAWTWLFPSYCEAWVTAYGNKGKNTAFSWLASSARLVSQGCVNHLPEIMDGDFPHRHRGCDAQAWGASEFVRVWKLLQALD